FSFAFASAFACTLVRWVLAVGWGDYSEFHAQAPAGNGDAVAIYEPSINVAGNYEIFEWHGQAGRNDEDFQEAMNVPYYIIKDGSTIASGRINQTINVGQWNSVGTFKFPKGKRIIVKLTNDADGVVISDAIRFVYMESDSGDNVPPNAPRSLNSTNQTDESITLSWLAPLQASDGDVASNYDIYRNKIYVGMSDSTVFTDTSLTINTTYSYEVYAVDESENMSLAPATGTFSTTNNAAVYSLNLSVVPDNIGKIQYYPIKERYISNETVVLSAIPSNINGTYNGNIYIESETGSLSGKFGVQKSQTDPEVFYLFSTQGDPMAGAAEYSFEIQEAGNYVIWGRCYSFNQIMDSFFMEVDNNGNVITWHLSQNYNNWIWQKVTENRAVKFFYFTPGMHKLKIIKREDNTRIDKVIITKNMAFTPSGEEDALIKENIYQFNNWSGSLTGSSNPAEIIMNEDKTISAHFASTLIVTTPNTPVGPDSGYVGEMINFSSSGSTCSNGDDVEYQFDWGNGEQSDWNVGSVYYTYTSPGIFNIKGQARCQQHTDIISDWSADLQIDITVSENKTYNVSGRAIYDVNNLPIQNVSLTISGDITGTKVTTADGMYTFLVDSGKSIIVTPEKEKGEEVASYVITTYDAALTAQHSIGTIQLGSNQQIAADVDQSGMVQMFDAALIAQYSVGISPLDISKAGEWYFLPGSINLNGINSDLTVENFTAIIIGNVDGAWSQPGLYKQKNILATGIKDKIKIERNNNNIAVLINVEREQRVLSANIEMNFDNKTLEYIEYKKSPLSSDFQVVKNFQKGRLRIGMYSTEPINGSGELLRLIFTQTEGTNEIKPFLMTKLIINDNVLVNATSAIELSIEQNEIHKFELYQNYPNPFNNRTTIKYKTQKDGFGEITIFNIFGRKVKTLINGQISKGYHEITWDGKDENGKNVASGVYFYQLKLDEFKSIKKLLMIE
ncbi:T9SS type A sorting domain-containing protein, partial [candidate division KSB1 bacterium]|nr:T9SS type A sorting domain-containing protein [candidate division KSB1 bacterium]